MPDTKRHLIFMLVGGLYLSHFVLGLGIILSGCIIFTNDLPHGVFLFIVSGLLITHLWSGLIIRSRQKIWSQIDELDGAVNGQDGQSCNSPATETELLAKMLRKCSRDLRRTDTKNKVLHDIRSSLGAVRLLVKIPSLSENRDSHLLERLDFAYGLCGELSGDRQRCDPVSVPTNVSQIAEQVAEIYQSLWIGYKKLNVRLYCTSEYAVVSASASDIKRLLGNLLDNAARHSGFCSCVSVRVFLRGAEVGMSVFNTKSWIRDGGELMSGMFSVSPGKSRGLGLSICQDIVSSYGGSMSCESHEGKGTCFTIYLPRVVT